MIDPTLFQGGMNFRHGWDIHSVFDRLGGVFNETEKFPYLAFCYCFLFRDAGDYQNCVC
jgi:hypothetical protein